MNQPVDPNEDTTTAGLGERRRRREAERARARAAGRVEERPLTRRERRARDEALASGALTYGPDGLVPTSEFERIEAESLSAASAAEPVSAASAASATDPLPRSRRARREAERAATAASAVSALSAPSATEPPAEPKTARTEEPVRRREPDGSPGSDPGERAARREPEDPAAGSMPEEAAADRPSEEPAAKSEKSEKSQPGQPAAESEPGESAADRAPEEPEEQRQPEESGAGRTSEDQETRPELEEREGTPAMPSAPSPDGGPATALMVPVSRKSLRDKRAAAPAPATMDARPAERTSTGRRPVVRPPASVRARRGVDGSGELTAIQRAVREANTAAEGIAVGEQGESSSPTSWHSAVDIPAVSYEVGQQAVRPGATAASAPTAPQDSDAVSAPSAGSGPTEVSAPSAGSGSSTASAPTTDSGPTVGSAPSSDSGPAAASAPTPARAPEVTSPQEPHSPSSAAPAVASADTEDDDDGAFDMTPRWESLQRAAALRARADAEPAAHPTPPLRTSAMRAAEVGEPPVQPLGPAEEDPEDELREAEARKTPGWLFALQMLVLVLVIAILGALVYLFATGDLFGDDDAAVLGLSGSVLWSTGR